MMASENRYRYCAVFFLVIEADRALSERGRWIGATDSIVQSADDVDAGSERSKRVYCFAGLLGHVD